MKLVWCGLVLILGCHKNDPAASHSAGSSEIAGSATAGSGTASSGTVAGSASSAAGPQVTALDELDRWIAPLYKLDVAARYKALCGSTGAIGGKVAALKALGPASGGDAQGWSNAVDNLTAQVDGVKMCCKDAGDYDTLSPTMKEAADSNHEDCLKPVPDAFAAVVKLVPGAKPPGTHAGDPVMKP